MNPKETALLLIGYQNDYFSQDGILYSVIEEQGQAAKVLVNSIELIRELSDTSVLMVSTPIIFSPDYHELVDPVGILKTIKEVGAFKSGNKGSKTIEEFKEFSDRIIEVKGKQSFNAFSNTKLESILKENKIKNIIIAGAITSICIDSTGRSAVEKGFKVTVLSDCSCGRTSFEQQYYCENIFPAYGETKTAKDMIGLLKK